MGAKRPEPAPPKFQPVMMDEQGNYYKENPEYTKRMAKLRSHPFTMMGAAKNPSSLKRMECLINTLLSAVTLNQPHLNQDQGMAKPNPTTQIERYNDGKYKSRSSSSKRLW